MLFFQACYSAGANYRKAATSSAGQLRDPYSKGNFLRGLMAAYPAPDENFSLAARPIFWLHPAQVALYELLVGLPKALRFTKSLCCVLQLACHEMSLSFWLLPCYKDADRRKSSCLSTMRSQPLRNRSDLRDHVLAADQSLVWQERPADRSPPDGWGHGRVQEAFVLHTDKKKPIYRMGRVGSLTSPCRANQALEPWTTNLFALHWIRQRISDAVPYFVSISLQYKIDPICWDRLWKRSLHTAYTNVILRRTWGSLIWLVYNLWEPAAPLLLVILSEKGEYFWWKRLWNISFDLCVVSCISTCGTMWIFGCRKWLQPEGTSICFLLVCNSCMLGLGL